MSLSPDSLVLLLLCSHLGLPDEDDTSPLTLREWTPLARKLQLLNIPPRNLVSNSAIELQNLLQLNPEQSTRLANLLGRGEIVDRQLVRFASLGIRVLTIADTDYPGRYRQRLKESAPLVLFYAGELALLGQPGIAVVGSRNLDPAGQECAAFVGNACGLSGLVLYSGGARGVDKISMEAALAARGTVVGILADSLEHARRAPATRAALDEGNLCLVTPYSPNAGFSVGAAMGRNRLIYTLADYAVVVASDAETGGTWSGAVETIKHDWVPVYVLEHANMPAGNRLLLERGALAFPYPFKVTPKELPDWLKEHTPPPKPKPSQPGLF